MTIERKIIHVLRHAQPEKDPETQRSLDYLTEQGKADAEALGTRLYSEFQGPITVMPSPMFRAYQTGNRMMEGARKVPLQVQPTADLGLDFFNQAQNKPSGIAYGPEFIDAFLKNNPGVDQRVVEDMISFIGTAYDRMKGQGNAAVIGISHGPKVEIGYGALMGIPNNEIGQFAASPLDGFIIKVDRAQRSGDILQATIQFKDLDQRDLDQRYLA